MICLCTLLSINAVCVNAGADTNFFSIHFGSYKSVENAREEVTRIRESGYDSFYRGEAVQGNGHWYRVYIGEYRSQKIAEREAVTLQDSGLISYCTVRTLSRLSSDQSMKIDRSGEQYGLYVGLFKRKADADDLVDQLQVGGLYPISQEEIVTGNRWYRVYILSFQTRSEAIEKGSELKREGLIKYYRPILMDAQWSKKYLAKDSESKAKQRGKDLYDGTMTSAQNRFPDKGSFNKKYHMREMIIEEIRPEDPGRVSEGEEIAVRNHLGRGTH